MLRSRLDACAVGLVVLGLGCGRSPYAYQAPPVVDLDLSPGFAEPLWIANTEHDSVTRIDTFRDTAQARYATDAAAFASPSRISVNLLGHAAVANRGGSVVYFSGHQAGCRDRNDDGRVTTSQGPDDQLAFAEDECLLWHRRLPGITARESTPAGPRALAWDGQFPPRLWVSWGGEQPFISVARLAEADGETLDEIEIPGWNDNRRYGMYAAAVDANDNLWGISKFAPSLVRVDSDSLEVDRWFHDGAGIFYGLALDEHGTPWISGGDAHDAIWSFDRTTERFVEHTRTGHLALRGVTVDEHQLVWFAANRPCGAGVFNPRQGQLLARHIELPGCDTPVGITLGANGAVFVVDKGGRLFRIDRRTLQARVAVQGLGQPYSYSDMSGNGLRLVLGLL
ncbi:MAG: hypothetical protein B7733_13230 [Myxococcales bacterium FL481]|nr:MAG: hypothetical protein B7733_13230 [Myxococcales bacterium FL481]